MSSTKKVKSSVVKSTTSVQKVTVTSVRSYTSIEIKRDSVPSKISAFRNSELSLPQKSIALDGPLRSNEIKKSNPFFAEFGSTPAIQSNPKKHPKLNSNAILTKKTEKLTSAPKYESPYRTAAPFLKTTSAKNDNKLSYVSPYRGNISLAYTPKSNYVANVKKPTSSVRPPALGSRQITPPAKKSEPPPKYEEVAEKMKRLNMDRPKSKLQPGNLYIFNHEKFDDPKNETRVGSEADVKLLEKTFKQFNLSINSFKNFTVREVRHQMEKIEKKDFSQKSCIVIAIMSHGSRLETIAAKDGSYSIDDDVLFPILRNRTLEAKPKILIIQACKGEMDLRHYKTDASPVQRIGRPSEILKCYSTFEGYVSYRSSQGSVFITTLCELLQQYGASRGIKEIMEACTSKVKMLTRDMQIPTISTTLTKSYVFGDYV